MRYYLLLFIFCSINSAKAQSLKIRENFGTNGHVFKNLGNDAKSHVQVSAVQPDGKILVGGDMLVRIHPDGEKDDSFKTLGPFYTTQFVPVEHLAIQPDGKILYTLNNGDSIRLLRINSDGSTDSSFYFHGEIRIGAGLNEQLVPRRIKVQPGGEILIGGYLDTHSPVRERKIFLIRLLSDGSYDYSFYGTGTVYLQLTAEAMLNDFAFQSNGDILITGNKHSTTTLRNVFFLARLFSNGGQDMSFNGTGILEYGNIISQGETGDVIHVYPDDKIVVAGVANENLLLVKTSADGYLDTSFNHTGIAISSNGLHNKCDKIHIRDNNKILVTGTNYISELNQLDLAAFQFEENGQPDSSFNGTGKTHFARKGHDRSIGSVLLPDGDILMLCERDSVELLSSAKLQPNGTFDLSYGTNGFKYSPYQTTEDYTLKVLQQPDGKAIVIAAKSLNVLNNAASALVRYNADGSIDNSFGINGMVYIDSSQSFETLSALRQNDGKIIILGLVKAPNDQNRVKLSRYNTDGSLDNNFNSAALAGRTLGSNGDATFEADASGNMIVAIKDYSNYPNISFYKLTPDGIINPSFGTNGKAVLTVTFDTYDLKHIAFQADGKILLSGTFFNQQSDLNIFCTRLNSNGSKDVGFAQQGFYINTQNLASVSDVIGLYVTPEQRIILSGFAGNYEQALRVIIEQLLPTGQPDISFGGTGRISLLPQTTSFPTIVFTPTSMAIHPDSSIYITGSKHTVYSDYDHSSVNFLIHVSKRGVLDSALSVDGTGWYIVPSDFVSKSAFDFTSIAINADSIIFVGSQRAGQNGASDINLATFKRLPADAGRVYTFTGNGNWTSNSNWRNGAMPPEPLPDGSIIVIDPTASGTAIINIPQTIAPGGSLNVKPGSKLIIQGNLNIAQ